jgi:ABC-type phosphate/phosphonate transport system permease subunit
VLRVLCGVLAAVWSSSVNVEGVTPVTAPAFSAYTWAQWRRGHRGRGILSLIGDVGSGLGEWLGYVARLSGCPAGLKAAGLIISDRGN